MTSALDLIKKKIIDSESELDRLLAYWKFTNKKIVFTNGCFDIIHRGHVEYLALASNLGDILFVGLNTDISVKRLKGPERPIQDEKARSIVLAALGFVDHVMLFNEDTPYELIKKIQPNVLVKGKDYKAEDVVGYDIVKAKGGQVITIELVSGYSTTNIINKSR